MGRKTPDKVTINWSFISKKMNRKYNACRVSMMTISMMMMMLKMMVMIMMMINEIIDENHDDDDNNNIITLFII
jgi:hypothetical protein